MSRADVKRMHDGDYTRSAAGAAGCVRAEMTKCTHRLIIPACISLSRSALNEARAEAVAHCKVYLRALVITRNPFARVTASGISQEQRDYRHLVTTRLKRRENEVEISAALREALDRRGS